jgi:hypothetical protein
MACLTDIGKRNLIAQIERDELLPALALVSANPASPPLPQEYGIHCDGKINARNFLPVFGKFQPHADVKRAN